MQTRETPYSVKLSFYKLAVKATGKIGLHVPEPRITLRYGLCGSDVSFGGSQQDSFSYTSPTEYSLAVLLACHSSAVEHCMLGRAISPFIAAFNFNYI